MHGTGTNSWLWSHLLKFITKIYNTGSICKYVYGGCPWTFVCWLLYWAKYLDNVSYKAGAWAIIKMSGHQHRWLAGGYDLEIGHFLEVDSMVVTWWIVAFLRSVTWTALNNPAICKQSIFYHTQKQPLHNHEFFISYHMIPSISGFHTK